MRCKERKGKSQKGEEKRRLALSAGSIKSTRAKPIKQWQESKGLNEGLCKTAPLIQLIYCSLFSISLSCWSSDSTMPEPSTSYTRGFAGTVLCCPSPPALALALPMAVWDPGSGSSSRGCSRADPAPENARDRHLSPCAHHAESWQSGKGHFQPLCPASSGTHWSIPNLLRGSGTPAKISQLWGHRRRLLWTNVTYPPSPSPLSPFAQCPRITVSFLVQSFSFDLSPRDSRRKAKQVIWGKTYTLGDAVPWRSLFVPGHCLQGYSAVWKQLFFSPSALQSWRSFEFTLSFSCRRQKGPSRTWNETDAYGIVVLKAFFSWVLSFSTQNSPMWAD